MKRKVLSSINFRHQGLEKGRFISIGQYTAMSAVISNYRRKFWQMGYDCSLLDDCDMLAFEELIFDAETSEEGKKELKNTLDFLTVEM